jgi:spore coat polysaccharide biosynthesis protein SpsF
MNGNGTTAVFLQARLGSRRLPHKILLDLGGRTVLEQCMARLGLVEADVHVVLTDTYSFPVLDRICRRHAGWECFMGPAQDVLGRYVFASRHFGVDTIIRATADNPLVSYELANALLADQISDGPADYRAHLGIPYGAGVELVRSDALEKAFVDSMDPYDREHVCPYLYNHADVFRVVRSDAPPEYSAGDLRLTLDTEEDYRFLKALYRQYPLENLPSLSSVIKSMYSLAV